MVKNLTPHPVKILGEGWTVEIPSTGVLRLREEIRDAGTIDGIPVIRRVFGEIEGLPEETPGVFYIVSLPVFAATNRKDFLAVGETVRNEKGEVIGCKNLVRK